MESSDWKIIEGLFEAIIALPKDEQLAYLERHCPSDAVRQEVLSLLDADRRMQDFLTAPTLPKHQESFHPVQPGMTIGPYQLKKLIGEGGMGVVYQALDTRLQRLVALKFLTVAHKSKAATPERFLNEAQAASQLDHMNVCTIHDIGHTDAGVPYIAMGYYPGITLDKYIEKNPSRTLTETLSMMLQILSGIQAAHKRGILHRDLKPANVILTDDHVIKILDFGIAKIDGVDMTTTGNQVGTIAYMAPEQLQGGVASQQSDLWSYGVMLYELLTGQRPFEGTNNFDVMSAIQKGIVKKLAEHNPQLPDTLQPIIDRLLCKDLDYRYPSAAAVMQDLSALVDSDQSGTTFSAAKGNPDATTGLRSSTSTSSTIFGSDGDLRQATVMAIDLCNFSRILTEKGPAFGKQIAERFFGTIRDVVASFGGVVNRELDNTSIVLFGVPVAHDKDTFRAIKAASACHEAVKKLGETYELILEAHIGISSGTVVMNTTNDGLGGDIGVTGEALSLATRLDDMAEPGETIISDSLYEIVNTTVSCGNAGTVKVRYHADPIKIWRIIEFIDVSDEHILPIVGRDTELQQIQNILGSVAEGQRGHIVYICGEAGIGKTRFADECRKLALERGYRCHSSLILDFGMGGNETAMGSLARSLLDIPTSDTSAQARANLQRFMQDNVIDDHLAVCLSDLIDAELDAAQRQLFELMDHGTRVNGVRDAIKNIIAAKSKRQSLFILVEDLHWATDDILENLAAIGEEIHSCPVLVLLTSRPDNEKFMLDWRSRRQVTPLTSFYLTPLSTDESLQFARTITKTVGDDSMGIIERAQGNPLFLEQLLRNRKNLQDSPLLPVTVQNIIQSRLDKLDTTDRFAARAASIIGQRFNRELLLFLLETPDYDCYRLVKYQFVHAKENDFLFNHALIRDGIYASLLEHHKKELHLRAAQWYAEKDLALYAEHLECAGSEQAAAAFLQAADDQAQSYHFETARRLIERGKRLAQDNDIRYAFGILLAEITYDSGNIKLAEEIYRQTLDLAESEEQTCRIWIGLAQICDINDQHAEALEHLEAAQRSATSSKLTTQLSQIHYQRGNLFFPKGDIDACRYEHQTALDLATQADSPRHEAQALSGLGDTEYAAGRMRSAFQHFDRCLRLCKQYGYGRIEAANRFMLGTVRIYLNELSEALNDSLESASSASKVGHVRAEIVSRLTAGWIYIEQCDLENASEQVELGLTLTERLGAKRFEPFLSESKARILMAQGEQRQALQVIQTALEQNRDGGMQFIGPWLLGTLALVTDDSQTRHDALDEAEALLSQGCVGHNYYQFYRAAIELSLREENWSDAQKYTQALSEYTRQEPNPWADLHIEWAGQICAAGQSGVTPENTAKLQQLRDDAQEQGFMTKLPFIDRILKAAQ